MSKMQRKSLSDLAREEPAPKEAPAASEEKTVRLNLEVPRSLRAELQKRAIDEGVSMKDLGTRILRDYLNE